MKKLLGIALSVVAAVSAAFGDDRNAGERAIRDKNGKITGYVEHTVNGKRIRDVNQKIVFTIDKKESTTKDTKDTKAKK